MQGDAQRPRAIPRGGHGCIVRRGKADDRPLHIKALLLQDANRNAGIHAPAQPYQHLVLLLKGIESGCVVHHLYVLPYRFAARPYA